MSHAARSTTYCPAQLGVKVATGFVALLITEEEKTEFHGVGRLGTEENAQR